MNFKGKYTLETWVQGQQTETAKFQMQIFDSVLSKNENLAREKQFRSHVSKIAKIQPTLLQIPLIEKFKDHTSWELRRQIRIS